MDVNYVEFVLDEGEDYSLEDAAVAIQQGINSGMVWRLEGARGRQAQAMIDAGLCMLGKVGYKDYWGNYVPSRFEVKDGSVGSPDYCREALEYLEDRGEIADATALFRQLKELP